MKTIMLSVVILAVSSLFMASCKKEAPAAAAETTKAEAPAPVEKIKAGFVYIGPAGDFGWTYAHEKGRQYVQEKFGDWLETITVESVPEGDAVRFIDRMVREEKCDIIFTTSFGYMDDTVAAAAKYPDVKFYHCSGYMRSPNMGTYMGDMYQIYYLNGLIAGALTESNKIGYVAAFPIPELFRHMNAFALGIKEVNPEATVDARWTYAWYGPAVAREAAEALVADGVDVLAFTEDTPSVVEVAQEHTEKGEPVYAFSHYSPMQSYGEDSVPSGQLTDWGILYEKALSDYKANPDADLSNYDVLYLLKENAVDLGASYTDKINPKFVDRLKGIMVDDKDFGNISVYDLVMKRYDQMKQGREVFDPYMGPIADQTGTVRIPAGEIASIGHLFGEIDYQVDNFVSPLP
ncbi:MAG: BMP family ABC transporter substrate-binding protein [Spirochaetales bacterium]|nr:BMP family ABC transporter substrate-binding protein [Spirochaetales bacterium]